MKCPNCSNLLSELHVGGTLAHVCRECHSLWFKKDELGTLGKNIIEHGWFDISLWEKKELLTASPSTHHCPSCLGKMSVVNWNNGELISELCPSCGGLWLPKGEYQKVLRYLTDKADSELVENYGTVLSHEISRILSGEGDVGAEVGNLGSLLSFFKYRFIAKHPLLTEVIEELPFST